MEEYQTFTISLTKNKRGDFSPLNIKPLQVSDEL